MNSLRAFFVLLLAFAISTSTFGFQIKLHKTFDVNGIQIQLFTPKNPTEPQLLSRNDIGSVINSNFDQNLPTRIFIHGFRSKGQLKNILTETYFVKSKHEINLIGINWEKASPRINYPGARGDVDVVGNFTAEFIDFMVENEMVKLADLTVIGFSLGAHIAGISGKRVKTGRIGKIVGLDPAGPLFTIDKPEDRLDSTDAIYVETIHTSRLGFFEPLGNVSFYPFGGKSQPTCSSWNLLCQHRTAYKYFAQSILSKGPLIGHSCGSLDDVTRKSCEKKGFGSIFGGEPGAKKQQEGIFYIEIDLPHEKGYL